MDLRFESIRHFFDKLKNLNLWQRIFKWSKFLLSSSEVFEEIRTITERLDSSLKEVDQLKIKIEEMSKNIVELNSKIIESNHIIKQKDEKIIEYEYTIKTNLDQIKVFNDKIVRLESLLSSRETEINQINKKLLEKEIDLATIKEKLDNFNRENTTLKEEIAKLKQIDDERQKKYFENVAQLNQLKEKIDKERQQEMEETKNKEIERIKKLKEKWSKHQDETKNWIKRICEKNIIEYVEKVPFKGEPDNAIKINDEYIIFDAKSPAGEDFSNFSTYLKNQAENAKKYAKQENVKKDIFFVVPSNTLEYIDYFCYNLADYNVYIISIDALEPVILSLKKLEEYEFINQLSPDERENICRIIGKFAHMTKRRIQIDQFFTMQFLEILTKCQNDLPKEFFDKVLEYERAEKLNPPIEKRAKQISINELENESKKLIKESEAKSIVSASLVQAEIKSLPLYEDEKNDI